ncbi:MAG: hypothetical protein B7Y41_08065 [Hydrogenophilales bacterium 28-61-23]|nr:MAG: hypothetical protein B7Y41_08065 [Hydrogenophilales bacterium 28-61-23]
MAFDLTDAQRDCSKRYAFPISPLNQFPLLIMDGLGNAILCRRDKASQLQANRDRAAYARLCRKPKRDFLAKQADLFDQVQEIGGRTGERSEPARPPISPFPLGDQA